MKNLFKTTIKWVRTELAYRILTPRRVLFDHLPKCAGTTIISYLELHYPRRLIFRTNVSKSYESISEFQSLPKSSRYNFRLIVGHLANQLLDYVHPDTITLTIFRDPIDRIVSHYFFVKQNKHHYLHEKVLQSNIQLKDYASSGLSTELRNWYTTHFTGLSIEEVEKKPEESVHRALQVISQRFHIIGFQDNLVSVSHKLRNVAHLYKRFANQVINKTKKRITVKEIDENVKNKIAEVNFLDVKLYGLLKARMGLSND